MTAQFESEPGPEEPTHSSPIEAATNDLPADAPVTAAELVDGLREPLAAAGISWLPAAAELAAGAEPRRVTEWVRDVRALFDESAVPELEAPHLVRGASLLDADLSTSLGNAGVLADIDATFDEPLAALLTETGRSIWTPEDSVPTQPDRPVAEPDNDQLHRVAFARYLARRVAGVTRARAYAVNLYGAWGSGKSTLLNFIERELTEGVPTTDPAVWVGPEGDVTGERDDSASTLRAAESSQASEFTARAPTTSWQVVRFNAWQNQHVEPPWWALMDHVYQQSKDELDGRHRVSEAWWRLRSGRLPFLVGLAALAWVVALTVPAFLAGTATLGSLAQTADALGKLLAVGVTLWAAVEGVTSSLFTGSAKAAQSYVDYVADPMNAIEARFTYLIDRIPKPVAIFIDDLDRCDSAYVVELLEGIQTLFTDAPVVFVVAADRDWIVSCFEAEYADQAVAADRPGHSLGGLFLEKTFQLTAPVPTIPEELKADYWQSLLVTTDIETAPGDESVPGSGSSASDAASDALAAASSEEDIREVVDEAADRSFAEQQSIREAAVTRLADPEIVARTEHVLAPLAPLLKPNPRAMKRLVNTYSVNRALVVLGDADVDRDPLALWTILSLQYPQLADYLARKPEAVEQVGEYPPGDVEGDLAALFRDEHVVDVVEGTPVEGALDESAVARCAAIRP